MLARPRYGEARFPAMKKVWSLLATATAAVRGWFSDRHVRPDRDCRAVRQAEHRRRQDDGVEEQGAAGLSAAQTLAADASDREHLIPAARTRARVRRALAALFGGAVGKDTVSRVWRRRRLGRPERPFAGRRADRAAHSRRHRGARAARPVGDFHLAARRYRCARRTARRYCSRSRAWAAKAPRHGALSSMISSSAVCDGPSSSSSTARQGLKRQLPLSGTACRCRGAQYTSIATCSPLPPSACTRRSAPTTTT